MGRGGAPNMKPIHRTLECKKLDEIYKNRLPKSVLTAVTQKCMTRYANGEFNEGSLSNLGFVLRSAPLFCDLVVTNNPWNLEFIPDEVKDSHLCMIAVKEAGFAIEYVPEELKDEKLCLEAVKQRGPFGFERILRFIPLVLRKQRSFWIKLIELDSQAYHSLPFDLLQDAELAYLAVKKDPLNLRSVPGPLKTLELCTLALKNKDMFGEFQKMHVFGSIPRNIMLKIHGRK